jgi:hypothetical protein
VVALRAYQLQFSSETKKQNPRGDISGKCKSLCRFLSSWSSPNKLRPFCQPFWQSQFMRYLPCLQQRGTILAFFSITLTPMSTPVSSIRNFGPAFEQVCTPAGIASTEALRVLGADAANAKLIESGTRPHFIGYYFLVVGL